MTEKHTLYILCTAEKGGLLLFTCKTSNQVQFHNNNKVTVQVSIIESLKSKVRVQKHQ